jgi:hypothetical protein
VELVIAGDLLHQRAIVLEQHEEAQVVEQHGRRQQAAHQRFQFVELTQRVERHPVDGAPLHEALRIRRQRTQPRLAAVGNHQQLVVLEHVRNLLLVGLDLVVGLPDVGVFVGRVLQFQQHQRQAIDEQDHVRPAGVLRPLDRELPLIASHSLHAGSAQSIRRTKSPRVSPSFWYCTGTPPTSSR